MKKLWLSSAAVAAQALATSAGAADLGPRPVYKAPPAVAPVPVPVFSWTGLYFGGNGGCGWYNTPDPRNFNIDKEAIIGLTVDIFSHSTERSRGCFGGGQIGFNYQFANNVVIGIEADADFGKISSSNKSMSDFGGTIELEAVWKSELTSFGTARGRLGYAFGRWLPFFTGGFAWGQNKLTVIPDDTGPTVSARQTHTGWAVGGGLEYAFTPNLSLKAEYLYLDLNSQHYNIALDADPGVVPGLDFERLKVHTFKTGLNWRFNWGKTAAPVVARY